MPGVTQVGLAERGLEVWAEARGDISARHVNSLVGDVSVHAGLTGPPVSKVASYQCFLLLPGPGCLNFRWCFPWHFPVPQPGGAGQAMREPSPCPLKLPSLFAVVCSSVQVTVAEEWWQGDQADLHLPFTFLACKPLCMALPVFSLCGLRNGLGGLLLSGVGGILLGLLGLFHAVFHYSYTHLRSWFGQNLTLKVHDLIYCSHLNCRNMGLKPSISNDTVWFLN